MGQTIHSSRSRFVARLNSSLGPAKTIHDRLLKSLGVPNFNYYRRSEREDMLLKSCVAAQVRLLILDELQDVLTSTARQHQIALDTIKFLMNQLNVSILALGTKRVPATLRVDEHLNARFKFRELSPWQNGDRLRRLLHAFERGLPLSSPSHLASPEMASLLAHLCNGSLRALAELLSLAAAHAVEPALRGLIKPCWNWRWSVRPSLH